MPEDLTSTASRTPLLMSVQAGMATGSTITVALRFYTRFVVTHNVGYDDWCMLAALIFSWGVSGPGLASAHYGMGRHIGTINGEDLIKALMWVWYARLSAILSFCFVKMAIAALLLRIFTITRGYRFIIYSSIIVNICVSIVWLIMTIRCIPARGNWDSDAEAKCIPTLITVNHAYFAGAAHSALDLLYVVLPVLLVWSLRLPNTTKIALSALLSLGLFACACSIIKITFSAQLGQTQDITWAFTDLSIWNIVELNVGIICGSVPCLRPLFKSMYEKASSAVRSSAGHPTGGWNGVGSANTNTGTRRSKYGSMTGRNGDFDMPSYPRQAGKVIDDDGNSTENMLPAKEATILRTTEVEIVYNQK